MKKLLLLLIILFIIPIVTAQNVEITFLSQDPDPVEPGEIVDLRYKIENFGSRGLENIKFKLIPEYPLSVVPGGDLIKEIFTLQPSQRGERAITLLWKLKVDDDAPTGDYDFDISMINEQGSSIEYEDFEIRVQSRDSILSIDSVDVVPENPRPGEEVDITINLKNLESIDLEDIRVKLDLDDVIASLGSTNEKIIPRINRGSKEQVKFKLIVNPDSHSKVYSIPLKIEYSDKFGNKKSISTSFGLKIYSPPDYVFSLAQTDVYTTNSQGEITLSMSNTGISDINFVTVELLPSPNYDIISTGIVYIGNVESDDYETAEFNIFTKKPNKEGIIPIKAKLKFKDSYNVPFEEIIEIPLEVYTSRQASKYGIQGVSGGFISKLILFLMFGVPLIVFWLFMLFDVFSRKMPRTIKRAWVLIIILSNVVGAILYFFFGRKMGTK